MGAGKAVAIIVGLAGVGALVWWLGKKGKLDRFIPGKATAPSGKMTKAEVAKAYADLEAAIDKPTAPTGKQAADAFAELDRLVAADTAPASPAPASAQTAVTTAPTVASAPNYSQFVTLAMSNLAIWRNAIPATTSFNPALKATAPIPAAINPNDPNAPALVAASYQNAQNWVNTRTVMDKGFIPPMPAMPPALQQA